MPSFDLVNMKNKEGWRLSQLSTGKKREIPMRKQKWDLRNKGDSAEGRRPNEAALHKSPTEKKTILSEQVWSELLFKPGEFRRGGGRVHRAMCTACEHEWGTR